MNETTYRPDTRQLWIIEPKETIMITESGRVRREIGSEPSAGEAAWFGAALSDDRLGRDTSLAEGIDLSDAIVRRVKTYMIPMTRTDARGVACTMFLPRTINSYYIARDGTTYRTTLRTGMPIDQITLRELNEQYEDYLIVTTDGRCRAFDGLTKICDVPAQRGYIPQLKAQIAAYHEEQEKED